MGYGWTNAIHPDDRAHLDVVWNQCVATRTTFDTETQIRGADGSYRWFKQRAVPLSDPAGGLDRWFGTSTDVTDVIEARNAMQAAKEDAEQVATTKTRFLAAASHDLRQPVQSLFMFAGALHGHVKDEKGRESLQASGAGTGCAEVAAGRPP